MQRQKTKIVTTSTVLNWLHDDKPRMMLNSSSKSSVVSGDCHFLVRGPVSRLGEGKEENQDDVPGTVPLHVRRARWLNNNHSKESSDGDDMSKLIKRQKDPNKMIFCCRPYSAFQAIPPTLLCPQFSQFMIDLDSCTPSTLDIEQFHQLRRIIADESIYDDGLERCAYFINNIREYGFRGFQ